MATALFVIGHSVASEIAPNRELLLINVQVYCFLTKFSLLGNCGLSFNDGILSFI